MPRRKFEPDEIVRYVFGGNTVEAVLHSLTPEGAVLIVAARVVDGPGVDEWGTDWCIYPAEEGAAVSSVVKRRMRLHPKRDQVWAEYVAARLAQ
jgi:hypothetical protein